MNARDEIAAAHAAGSQALTQLTEQQAAQLWDQLTTAGRSTLLIVADDHGQITGWHLQK